MILDTYASLFDGDLDEVADVLDLMRDGLPAEEARKQLAEANDVGDDAPDIGAMAVV
ncbi:hypothetical protein PAB09_00140 [Corynebacterium sp. SCR221107]|uniref:hypothetical protein n=1 Tax=Corynebacterium sp. SCR221107 TaxID=3017361 RepID=UPI0022EC6250|nr:hypothetical protein [Corynebacterium sp. SCR221107]WBT08813.1 hypothetical protein PAB09_00140 [Corynebacterium sp. SCR221107]